MCGSTVPCCAGEAGWGRQKQGSLAGFMGREGRRGLWVWLAEIYSFSARMARSKCAQAGYGAHIMNIKKVVLFVGEPFGVVVMPNASSSLSKHWVPVHTVCLSSVFRTSCMPGR